MSRPAADRTFQTATILVVGGAIVMSSGGLAAEPGLRGLAAGSVVLAAGAALGLRARGVGDPVRERAWLVAGVFGLALLLVSGLAHRQYSYTLPGDPMALRPWFLAAGLVLGRWMSVAPDRRCPWLLPMVQLTLVLAFAGFTRGELPTRDDHPAFLYRFVLLREMFPDLVFYNPQWNGGYIASEIVATGALSPFLLSLPFAFAGRAEAIYAWAIPWLFIVLLPWILYATLRLARVGPAGAAIGACLAIAPTTMIFEYELLYGLYPFVISSVLAVPSAVVFGRLFLEGEGGWPTAGLLVVTTTLCVLWPLGALMLAPVLAAIAIRGRRFTKRQWALAIAIGAALLAINLPWIVALASYGDSARFLAGQRSPIIASGISWWEAARGLWRIVDETHPLVLAFAPAGIALWRRDGRGLRILIIVLFIWNLAVAVLGPQVKEQVALERFAVPAVFFAMVLSAVGIGRLFEGPPSPWRTLVSGAVLGGVLLGTVNAARYYQNRGHYGYRLLPADLRRTVTAIRDRCPTDRRVLVPGFSLHWFGGGHIAALPHLANRSFVGNDFYHRRDYADAVPESYRAPGRLGEYLDLYNVGCVLTWNEPWAATLGAAARARLIHDEGWVRVFAIDGVSSYFLRGSGRVEESLNRLTIETADDDVILKYRYFEGLRSIPEVPIEPHSVYPGVSFLRLRPGGHSRIEVRHR